MPAHVRVSGTWKKINKIYRNVGGTWKEVRKAYVNVGGTWKQFHTGAIEITVSTNQTNLNLFTFAGSPSAVNDYVVTINNGVTVEGNSTGTPALRTGSFPAGSTLTIINNGTVVGKGGGGGSGGIEPFAGSPGNAGGNAIQLDMAASIDNTSGNIRGGGGGGGGGGAARINLSGEEYNSSGAAGGTGAGPGAATNGSSGSNNNGAVGGSGGNGGDYGAAGSSGGNGSPSVTSGGAGGAAGKAVNLNGFSVTWLGGNNGTQVKGAVS